MYDGDSVQMMGTQVVTFVTYSCNYDVIHVINYDVIHVMMM